MRLNHTVGSEGSKVQHPANEPKAVSLQLVKQGRQTPSARLAGKTAGGNRYSDDVSISILPH